MSSIEFDQSRSSRVPQGGHAIGGRILNRSLREGDRLPPEMELRGSRVNRSTVREALRDSRQRMVTRRPGSKLMSSVAQHSPLPRQSRADWCSMM